MPTTKKGAAHTPGLYPPLGCGCTIVKSAYPGQGATIQWCELHASAPTLAAENERLTRALQAFMAWERAGDPQDMRGLYAAVKLGEAALASTPATTEGKPTAD